MGTDCRYFSRLKFFRGVLIGLPRLCLPPRFVGSGEHHAVTSSRFNRFAVVVVRTFRARTIARDHHKISTTTNRDPFRRGSTGGTAGVLSTNRNQSARGPIRE